MASALFGGGGIDDVLDLGDLVGGEAALLRVLAHQLLARRHVHAIDLVAGHVALHPLDLRAEALEHAARFFGDGAQLLCGELAGAGDLALDEVLGHGLLLSSEFLEVDGPFFDEGIASFHRLLGPVIEVEGRVRELRHARARLGVDVERLLGQRERGRALVEQLAAPLLDLGAQAWRSSRTRPSTSITGPRRRWKDAMPSSKNGPSTSRSSDDRRRPCPSTSSSARSPAPASSPRRSCAPSPKNRAACSSASARRSSGCRAT